MSSLRARLAGALIRAVVRRRDWGPPERLVRRARRLFGTPRWWARLRGRGVSVRATALAGVAGERLDPPEPTRRTVLYLHGGGYVACSPVTHRPITAALARLVPAHVVAPDYRLAPEHPFPAALEDAERVYRELVEEEGTPQATIAVAGDSAGGGLALALLLRLRTAGVELPACAVLFSPWTDLAGTGPSIRVNDGRCAMFRPENVPAFARCYAPEDRWRDPRASPLHGELGDLPPILVQVEASELLLDDAARAHAAIRAAGGASTLDVHTGLFHGWQILDGVIPEARASLARAADFIREQTASGG